MKALRCHFGTGSWRFPSDDKKVKLVYPWVRCQAGCPIVFRSPNVADCGASALETVTTGAQCVVTATDINREGNKVGAVEIGTAPASSC